MSKCKSCGEKPQKSRAFPSAVVEINNPEQLVLLRKVVIPASMPEETNPPVIGRYKNVILQYEDTNHLYIYSSDGIPTPIEANIPQEILDRIDTLESDVDNLERDLADETEARQTGDSDLSDRIDGVVDDLADEADARELADERLEDAIDTKQDQLTAGANIAIVDESGVLTISAVDTIYDDTQIRQDLADETLARQQADNNLQSEIDTIVASSDVKDIVGTYAELEDYDTSTLGDRDIIKVLQDETQLDQTTYYRWSTSTETFSLIGAEGPYYTKAQTNELLDEKQDELVAGENITIADESGSLVISATDTTYTFDNTPTAGSDNPVTSQGIKNYVDTHSVTFKPFPASVVTDGTTQQFMNSIRALQPTVGMAYLGTVDLSDAPEGFIQEEVEVYVYSDYVLYCIMRSTDIAPYEWWCSSYNYQGWRPVNTDTTYTAGNGLDLTGTTFSVDFDEVQEKLTAGENITIADESGALVISAEGGSGAIELTSADYNWPTSGTATSVALWLLEPGIYYAGSGVSIKANSTTSSAQAFYVVTQESSGDKSILVLYPTGAGGTVYNVQVSNGADLGSSSITTSIVQSTGTSTTSVMSQNAVSSMVFADPSTRQKVQMGNNSNATMPSAVAIGYAANARGTQSVAIGRGAYVDKDNAVAIGKSAIVQHDGGIALGEGAATTAVGQMAIGTTNASYGYNSSNYRLLTGLYDGQSAHDAVTKGQMDTELSYKQDELTAGTGISIAEESGALVISATGAEIATINAQDWSALWQ